MKPLITILVLLLLSSSAISTCKRDSTSWYSSIQQVSWETSTC